MNASDIGRSPKRRQQYREQLERERLAAVLRCAGLLCHIGTVTGRGCEGNGPCPLEQLADRGVLRLPWRP